MTQKHSCAQCLFYDVCNSDELCEHYAPCHELGNDLDYSDEVIDLYHDFARRDYEAEYRDYLDRFYNET